MLIIKSCQTLICVAVLKTADAVVIVICGLKALNWSHEVEQKRGLSLVYTIKVSVITVGILHR